ncbi:MAG: hypothetical protein D6B25_16560 [Desulfobulbaceae bacterium]|nr:MAG: hypothetical protein D6B25_16560 [Desulfobulbaceae bacterium]
MKRIVLITFLLLLLVNDGFALSTLDKISRSADRDSVQVFMGFDQPPRYRSKITGKRLDIILENTQITESFQPISEDEKVIKFLYRKKNNSLELSFFFRYNPQRVTVKTVDRSTLVADILLGNRFTKTYQEFSNRLQGVTLLNRPEVNYANPLVSSPYAEDWYSFFSDYESDVTITAPVNFYIPNFPFSASLTINQATGKSFITDEIMRLAQIESWDLILSQLKSQLSSGRTLDEQKLLALMYGETLLRSNNFDGAYKQLYLLIENYPNEQISFYSRYLLSLLIATNGDPHQAEYNLALLAEDLKKGNMLEPFVQISQAEMCLATGQIEKLKTILTRDNIAYPDPLQKIRELRQADLLYETGADIKAYVTYTLLEDELALSEHPFSLNRLCAIYYEKNEFIKASQCYDQLADQLNERDQLGLAYYRAAMARLKFQQTVELVDEFERIEDAFPGTEAGFRAALKKTDIRLLEQPTWSDTALKYYRALAEKSIYRPVSEEAYFKEALLYHLLADDTKSIELLMTLLRNFRSGSFLSNPEALLVQLLPRELTRLVSEKTYDEALVLAQQNRRLFDNNWIDLKILSELAFSYRQLGIFDDAMRLYLYLIEIANLEEKEQYFIKLAEIAYEKGDYGLVEDFSTQYSYNYPAGQYELDMLYLRLKVLDNLDKTDEALALLPNNFNDQKRFAYLAAALRFKNNQYREVIDLATQYQPAELSTLPEEQLFFLAESYFQLGQFEESATYFSRVKDNQRFSGQSLFRLAEISESNGKETEALELYREIVSGDSDELWKRYAQRELQLQSLTEN